MFKFQISIESQWNLKFKEIMKFATYKVNDKITYGSVVESEKGIGFTDIGKIYGNDLREWIELDALDRLKEISQTLPVAYSENDIEYLPSILTGQKIVCIGVNYANRNAEYKDNSALPKYPSVFLRYLDSFVAHNQNVVRPPESSQLDYLSPFCLDKV